jgi:hypothetical protein
MLHICCPSLMHLAAVCWGPAASCGNIPAAAVFDGVHMLVSVSSAACIMAAASVATGHLLHRVLNVHGLLLPCILQAA